MALKLYSRSFQPIKICGNNSLLWFPWVKFLINFVASIHCLFSVYQVIIKIPYVYFITNSLLHFPYKNSSYFYFTICYESNIYEKLYFELYL